MYFTKCYTRNTPIGVVLSEPSAAIRLAMFVRFLVQGLTPQKAVMGALTVPLDSPSLHLMCNNAVKFVSISRRLAAMSVYVFFMENCPQLFFWGIHDGKTGTTG